MHVYILPKDNSVVSGFEATTYIVTNRMLEHGMPPSNIHNAKWYEYAMNVFKGIVPPKFIFFFNATIPFISGI